MFRLIALIDFKDKKLAGLEIEAVDIATKNKTLIDENNSLQLENDELKFRISSLVITIFSIVYNTFGAYYYLITNR